MSVLNKEISRLSSDSKFLKQIEANVIRNYSFADMAIITKIDVVERYVEGIIIPLSEKKMYEGVDKFKDVPMRRRMRAYVPMAFTLSPEVQAPTDAWTLSVGTIVLVTFTDDDFRKFLKKVVSQEIQYNVNGEYPPTTNEEHHTTQVGVVTLKITDMTI